MKVAIIGAGAAGLAAAYDLAGAGQAVTVYEAAAQVGGLASGFKEPHWDWTIERFYHHWFQTDKAVLELASEIGAGDKVRFPRPITAVYDRGRFHAFDSPLAVLTFPGLSWLDKLRFALAGAYLRFSPWWQPLERVTAHQWLSRWMGRRAYEKLWQPLLVGKFGDEHARQVNMAWFWARLHARTTRLGTFVGGFQAFFDALAEAARQRGAVIRLDTAVRTIAPRAGGGLTLQTPAGALDYDACLVTTSPALLSRLAPALPPQYLAQLSALKSMGAVVLILSLSHQLSEQGVYWHNLPKGEGFPFLALCEHTNFVECEHFGGDHIVYCGDYLDPSHRYFQCSHEEIVAEFLPALSRFNAKFERSWVKKTWLFREPYAQPVPPVNHSRNIPDVRTPIPGLYLASMSQVYPWDRGTNFAVELGRRTAKLMRG
ncbi:MAG: NAD(P)/FAD-dependent oxidoreductase [Deltaproteobacteria bacterium]|nr:NAD(P)/FAD-dependent oxidoreductase [Deltaproteobacteria bacterium]